MAGYGPAFLSEVLDEPARGFYSPAEEDTEDDGGEGGVQEEEKQEAGGNGAGASESRAG